MDLEKLKTLEEFELRDFEVPKVETVEDLVRIVTAVTRREHDYGTAVYAMSIAAHAAFRFVAGVLGVTGFQASCADLDFVKRTRRLDLFALTDYSKLLYPQYVEEIPDAMRVLQKNAKWFREKARELLAEDGSGEGLTPSSAVRAHWRWLAALPVQEHETEGGDA